MDIQGRKRKERRNEDQLNKRKKFCPWLVDMVHAVQAKKRKERQNEDQLNKRKKLRSWFANKKDRRWQTTIPHDILSIISDMLPLSDFINFRGVCRDWRRDPSCRSNITKLSKKYPWCILYDFDARDKDMCLFYQCNSRRSCMVKLPGLRGAKCFVSKYGWLFIRRNNDYLLFNPLTLEEKFLPKYPSEWFGSSACQVGTFSKRPDSQNCVVVLLSLRDFFIVEVASCRLFAKKWLVTTITVDTNVVPSDSVLLPSPRCVSFKALGGGISRYCSSLTCIKWISVLYSTHYLIIDFSRKRYEIESSPEWVKKRNDVSIFSQWYSMLNEVHYDDWICRFGKEFTFSFCLCNDHKRDPRKRGDTCKRVFGNHCYPIPNVPVIKATWLKVVNRTGRFHQHGNTYVGLPIVC